MNPRKGTNMKRACVDYKFKCGSTVVRQGSVDIVYGIIIVMDACT
jgi:hypothetical protein